MSLLLTCEEELSLTAWLAWEIGIFTVVAALTCLFVWLDRD